MVHPTSDSAISDNVRTFDQQHSITHIDLSYPHSIVPNIIDRHDTKQLRLTKTTRLGVVTAVIKRVSNTNAKQQQQCEKITPMLQREVHVHAQYTSCETTPTQVYWYQPSESMPCACWGSRAQVLVTAFLKHVLSCYSVLHCLTDHCQLFL